MKITGVVAEYNPFHSGHEYQLKKARELSGCDCLAVVMSGNFVQRGEPAIVDKFKRAQSAVYGGADIVIELPMPFSCQSAELFSFAAMKELKKLHVDSISFGCENNDVNLFKKIASAQLTPEFNNIVKSEMKKGISYAASMSNALSFLGNDLGNDLINHNDVKLVFSPNNVLAVEYIKSAMKLNMNINYFPVKRLGSDHNDTKIEGEFNSATAIRKCIIKNDCDCNYDNLKLPEKSLEGLKKFYMEHGKYNTLNNYLEILYYKIIDLKSDLNNIYEINEGLNNKILNNIFKYNDVDDFIMSLKSKRYTYSKLRRSILNILLDIKKTDIIEIMSPANDHFKLLNKVEKGLCDRSKSEGDYVKVLAFNDKGREVIKYIKQNKTNVINRYSDYEKYGLNPTKLPVFNITNTSSNIYYLPLKNKKFNSEFTENAVYVKNI